MTAVTRAFIFPWSCRPALAAAFIVAMLTAGILQCFAAETFISIGTGEMNGVYYPVGKAICKVIGAELRAEGIWCSTETTPGSLYNVGAVQSGELEFAFVQSDVQFAADNGIGARNGKPLFELRSVLSLYPELVTVIARSSANIHELGDLSGKRVNVGSRGTGTRATWDTIVAESHFRFGRIVAVSAMASWFETREVALLTMRVGGLLRGIFKHPSPHPEEHREAMRLEG